MGDFARPNFSEVPAVLDPQAVPRSGVMGPGKFACPRARGASLVLTPHSECWSCTALLNEHAGDGTCPDDVNPWQDDGGEAA